ncbi:MAG: FmdB family zinc ribbon protein [Candidatus Tumulicola sp.]
MPLYDYKCAQCGKVTEVRHGFDDGFDSPCPACGGALSRVFNPASIVFKGSGFYVTDSRKKSAASEPKTADAPSVKTSEPKTESKTESKPAPAEKKADAKPADSAA